MIVGVWFLCYLDKDGIDAFFDYFLKKGKYLFLAEPYEENLALIDHERWLDEDQ